MADSIDIRIRRERMRPWWLAQTSVGLIQIGWRKRVLHIEWSATDIETVVTEDDVTKGPTMVHAWRPEKAVEYLRALLESHRASAAGKEK